MPPAKDGWEVVIGKNNTIFRINHDDRKVTLAVDPFHESPDRFDFTKKRKLRTAEKSSKTVDRDKFSNDEAANLHINQLTCIKYESRERFGLSGLSTTGGKYIFTSIDCQDPRILGKILPWKLP
ncbi:MAG: hypothetical protein IPP74_05830 [Alphaproteobacteria bacterium]|nr:hypothetical protein [Alphaproteobacteria bacterium]